MASQGGTARGRPAGEGSRAGLAALHGAVFLFGMAGLFGKWIAAAPLLIVFGRVAFATVALGALLVLRRRRVLPYGGWVGGLLPVCGAVLAFHWVAFFQAIQVSTVAIGLLGYATAPVFAGFLEPWVFREPFSRRSLAAALATLAGIALIVPGWSSQGSAAAGMAWGVAAGLSFAVLSLLNRRLRARYDAVSLAFYQDGAATLLLAPFVPAFWTRPGTNDLLLLALLGVVFTALAHGLFIEALRTVRARVATLVSNLEPVYGIALAALLLEEIPTPRTVAGGTLILLAVAWVTFRPGQPLEAGVG